MVIAEAAYLINRELGPDVEATLYTAIIDGALTVEVLTAGTGVTSAWCDRPTPAS
jgi:hypothetical protein